MFDHLLFLEIFFEGVAANGTPVRDLYEMVQHAGNVLTRLYLMITVGSVFIKSKELPARDVLNDLLEMVKGVQHPTRGLFLRYYLLQKCEDKLPEVGSEFAGEGGSLDDALHFTLTNFVEMAKLWVRMQHTTERSSQKRREKERRQIRAVVATAVGRIANLEGLTLDMFAQRVLPELLLQIQACGDKLAQEFLLDSITQSFSPTFSVATLVPYLRTLLRCNSDVDCQKIIAGHIARLTDAIDRSNGEPLDARSIAAIDAAYSHSEGVGFFSLPTDHDAYRGPEGVDIAAVAKAREATPADGAQGGSPAPAEGGDAEAPPVELGQGGIDGSGVRYSNTAPSTAGSVIPPSVPAFNIFFGYLQRLISHRADSPQPIEPLVMVQLFSSLLGLATAAYKGNAGHIDAVLSATGASLAASELQVDASASFAVETLYGEVHAALPLSEALALPAYGVLMRPLAYPHRRAIANKLMLTALGEDPTKPTGSAKPAALHLSSAEKVNQLFEALAPIIKEPEGTPPSAAEEGGASSIASLPEEFVSEQNNVARLVHLVQANTVDPAAAFKVLLAMRKHFGYGGAARVSFTLPPLVLVALHLTRRMRAASSAEEGEEAAAAATKALKDAFKFVHQTIQALGSSGKTVRALQLSMQAAVSASGSGFAYDFASQAFLFYEDVADSRTQVRCLDCIIGSLHSAALGGMNVEQYESLVTRATLSSTKLLRKPDQVVAVLRCAHLLWVSPSKASGIPPYHMSAQVLHCLKRALKIADECMPASNALFVRIFEAYVFFFERRVPAITATHINHNIALIQENLASMPDCEEKDSVATHFRNVMTHIATLKATSSGAELYAEVTASA